MSGGVGVKALVGFAIVSVVAAVIGGLWLVGTPEDARLRKFDARRLADIKGIANEMDTQWTKRGALPVSLDVMERMTGHDFETTDPETGKPFDYRVLGERRFELCADFALACDHSETPCDQPSSRWFPNQAERDWSHGAGTHCFELTAQELPESR